MRRCFFQVSVTVMAMLASACSASSPQQASPLAPTSVSPPGALAQGPEAEGLPGAGEGPADLRPSSSPGAQSVAFPASGNNAPSDVNFPPRNEPLQFRTALEAKYRDGLRRSSVQTFVDQEGTVVWTQEYLRYRVNLCPHTEAVLRVMRQIDGFGVQPVCGTTSSANFPPRNEPFDFMLQLEEKYRSGLRRSSGATFVDVEGNIVWTQEYLRYRVGGCGHFEAQDRVFAQIDGRGVQAGCINGAWSGLTSEGRPMSFTIANGSMTRLMYAAGFSGAGCTGTQTITWTLNRAISGNSFDFSLTSGLDTATFRGTFTGDTAAGSASFRSFVAPCGGFVTGSFTWTATKAVGDQPLLITGSEMRYLVADR